MSNGNWSRSAPTRAANLDLGLDPPVRGASAHGATGRSMEETLYLYSIPGMVESILEASNTPEDEWISHEEFLKILDAED